MEAWLIFLILAIVGILLYLNHISTKLKNLENEVHKLKRVEIKEDELSIKPGESKSIEIESPPEKAPAPKSASVIDFKAKPKEEKKTVKPSRTKAEWEALIGGKWLNWIGALALIIAAGFFLKYAFDKDWITEQVRVVIGFSIGISLIVAGGYFYKRKFDIFAQGLFGAGISILYLSIYASFNYYHLVSQFIAFLLMSFITIVSFTLAIRYKSQTISILSWLGGFLTPFLLSTGQTNEVGLFAYIVLLDLGILAIVLKREAWWVLEPLTLAATYLIYSAWYGEDYEPSLHLAAIVFLSIIWLLFFSLQFYRLHRSNTRFIEIRSAITILNTLLYYVMLYIVVDPLYHDYMASITILIAIVYLVGFFVLRWRLPENKTVHIVYSFTSIFLIFIATTIQFTDFVLIIFWALEALILVWFGIRWKLIYLWYAALGLLVVTIFGLVLTKNMLVYNDLDSYMLMLNPRGYATSITILVAFLTTTLSKRLEIPDINKIRFYILYGGSILLLLFLSVEINDFFRIMSINAASADIEWYKETKFLALAVVWMIYALIFIKIGLNSSTDPLLYCGITASFLAIVEAIIRSLLEYTPIEQFQVLINERMLAFVFLIFSVILISRWLGHKSKRYSWIPVLANLSRITLLILIFILLTSEIRDLFGHKMALLKSSSSDSDLSEQLINLANLQQLSLSGAWLFYSIILMIFGIWRRQAIWRVSSIVLFGLSVLKIFIYDLSFLEIPYRIISFFILGIILLSVSYLYNRYKDVIFT